MKKLVLAYAVALLIAVCTGLCTPASAFLKHGVPGGGGPPNPIVTMVAGTAIPQSQTNLQPSMSAWAPSCLDATWGVGCNVATQQCIAPTTGTPLETCAPPQMLTVTGGSGNGTTAEIDYTSAAGYALPVGQPANIVSSGVANWNTPTGQITGYTTAIIGSGPTYAITLTYSGSALPFAIGKTVYVGGMTGLQGQPNTGLPAGGFGWTQYQSVTSSGIAAVATTYYGVPITGGSGTGGTVNIVVNGGGGITLMNPANLGTGYVTGDVISGSAGGGTFSATANFVQPNGVWAVTGVGGSTVTFTAPGNITNTLSLNASGYSGTVTQPAVVSASSCVGTACKIQFPNATTCASSCASAATQIVAAQNAAINLAWDTGPIAPFAVENGTMTKCVDAQHLSPTQFVAFSADGGPFVKATTPVLDPWGSGQSGLTNNLHVYCAQIAANTISDGLHEIRAISCPTAGGCAQLSSALTVDARTTSCNAAGCTYLNAPAHSLGNALDLGISNSVDPAFTPYDWRYFNPGGISVTGATFCPAGNTTGLCAASPSTPPRVVYTFTQPTTVPPMPGHTNVNVVGEVTANSCSITGGTSNGAQTIYNYSGGCSFPAGSAVNIAGVTLGNTPILSASYDSTTGLLTLNFASAPNGASPTLCVANGTSQNITCNNYTTAGITSSPSSTPILAALNKGITGLVSSSGSGTTLVFKTTVGLGTLTLGSGSATLTGNTYAWNGLAVPIVATNGSSTITVSSLSTSVWASGGSITTDWSEVCATTDTSAVSGQITCPVRANTPATTWVSGGTITSQANLYCTVGGNGDNPLPYDAGWVPTPMMQQDAFQLLAVQAGTCTSSLNATGCHDNAVCGVLPTINSTLWLYRKDAGTDERGPGSIAAMNNNGSMWVYTNFNGAIQQKDSYVDSWNPSSAASGCAGPNRAAGAAPPTYSGVYCTDIARARNAMAFSTGLVTETATNSGGCLVLTASANSGMYVGEPINFQGIDNTSGGGQLMNFGLYWVGSIAGTGVTISTNPEAGTAHCITTTAANILTPKLAPDLSFDSIRFACNASLGCSTGNPETYAVGITGQPALTFYAKAGWLEFVPDTANGTTPTEVSLINGIGGVLNLSHGVSQGGRAKIAADTFQNYFLATPVIPVGPTPGALTATGGSSSGTSETLTFTATSGAVYQAADSTGSPGEQLTITGSGNATFDCTLCNVTASSASSVTITNPVAPSGSFTGASAITPKGLIVELAPGTFSNVAGSMNCTNSSGQAITPPAGATACLSGYAGNLASGTAPGLFPWILYPANFNAATALVRGESCFPSIQSNTSVSAITPSTGSGINDIMILVSNIAAFPIAAMNQCESPLHFANNPLSVEGFTTSVGTDIWQADMTWLGADYNADHASFKGILGLGASGGYYITNSFKENVQSAMDDASYVWGSNSLSNLGLCGNGDRVFLISHCQGGETTANPTYSNSGVSGMQVTDAFNAAGVRTVCNGSDPCITTATVTLQVNGGLANQLPYHMSQTWSADAICNFANPNIPSSRSLGAPGIIYFDDQHGLITGAGSFGNSTPCDITTSSPQVIVINTFHIDSFFTNTPENGTPSETPNYSPWIYYDNTMLDNASTEDSGTYEGYVNQGTTYQTNSVVNSILQSTEDPIPGNNTSLKAWGFNGYGWHNILTRNTAVWASVTTSHVTDVSGLPPVDNMYVINNNGGLNTLFPYGSSPDPRWTGFGGFTGLAWTAPVGSNTHGGSVTNNVVWPSLAAGVDGTGAANAPGAAQEQSLGACPWYCLSGDTGLGGM